MTVHVLICAKCRKGFLDEQSILDHQSHYQRLHAVDPEIDEHDGNPWDSATVEIGTKYTWEPHLASAREELIVSKFDDLRIWSTSSDGRSHWNSLDRFVEAVWPGDPTSADVRVRVVVAERELGLVVTQLDDGLGDALADGLGLRDRYRRDDMELLILNIIETRQLKKMVAALLGGRGNG